MAILLRRNPQIRPLLRKPITPKRQTEFTQRLSSLDPGLAWDLRRSQGMDLSSFLSGHVMVKPSNTSVRNVLAGLKTRSWRTRNRNVYRSLGITHQHLKDVLWRNYSRRLKELLELEEALKVPRKRSLFSGHIKYDFIKVHLIASFPLFQDWYRRKLVATTMERFPEGNRSNQNGAVSPFSTRLKRVIRPRKRNKKPSQGTKIDQCPPRRINTANRITDNPDSVVQLHGCKPVKAVAAGFPNKET